MYELRFLESTENIKRIVQKTFGRTPNSANAEQICSCIQQGRLYFESATNSSLIIKPVEIYYGILSFSIAIYLSKNLVMLNTLNQSHGLKADINNDLAQSTVAIKSLGTFPVINDIVCNLEGFGYFGQFNKPLYKNIPFTTSDRLSELSISLKNIFARIPGLKDIYKLTFDEIQKILPFLIYDKAGMDGQENMRIDINHDISDISSLRQEINKIRENYPLLNNWTLREATMAWGKAVLIFSNFSPTEAEFSERFYNEIERTFKADAQSLSTLTRIDVINTMPPVMGLLNDRHTYAVESMSLSTLIGPPKRGLIGPL